jgi:hypothetical protein
MVVVVVEPGTVVVVVVVGGAGHASPSGRGLHTKVNLSLSLLHLMGYI